MASDALGAARVSDQVVRAVLFTRKGVSKCSHVGLSCAIADRLFGVRYVLGDPAAAEGGLPVLLLRCPGRGLPDQLALDLRPWYSLSLCLRI